MHHLMSHHMSCSTDVQESVCKYTWNRETHDDEENLPSISAELETIGKNGTVEQAAELVTHLEQEYQRVCQALAAEIAAVE